ncbi:unnamed protein product [Auanema sp. JU1783]|nr:unnamed protein product [Auanema sp. JU1783]
MPSSLTYQMEFSQVAPVLLLFGILFIFSLVCIVDWYRSTNQEEDFMCDSQPMASADNKEVERHFTTI